MHPVVVSYDLRPREFSAWRGGKSGWDRPGAPVGGVAPKLRAGLSGVLSGVDATLFFGMAQAQIKFL